MRATSCYAFNPIVLGFHGRPTFFTSFEPMKASGLSAFFSAGKSLLWKAIGKNRDPNYFLGRITGVIHVGANLGQEAQVYALNNLNVLWVEPIPEIYKKLVSNIACYPNQLAAQALLLDEDGKTVTLNIANNDGASSSILPFKDHKEIWPDVHYVDQLRIDSKTLPSLLKDLDLSSSAYQALVMDTQGSELMIIKGAGASLDGIKYIKAEVPDFEAYSGCPKLREFTEFMKSLKYRLVCKCAFASSPGLGTYFDVVFERL